MGRARLAVLLAVVSIAGIGARPASAAVITSIGGGYVLGGASGVGSDTMSLTNGFLFLANGSGGFVGSAADLTVSLTGYIPTVGNAFSGPAFSLLGPWGGVAFAMINPGILQAAPATQGGVYTVEMVVAAEAGIHNFGGVGQLWVFNLAFSFVQFFTGAFTTSAGLDQTAAFNAFRSQTLVPEPASIAIWSLGAVGIVTATAVRRRLKSLERQVSA